MTSADLCTAGSTAVLRLPGMLQLAADPWAHEEDEGSNPRCTLRPLSNPTPALVFFMRCCVGTPHYGSGAFLGVQGLDRFGLGLVLGALHPG